MDGQVFELQAQYGDLETAPLLGNPWPASQFLSHLLGWTEEEPSTSLFAEYLNLTNLAYLVPGHDGECSHRGIQYHIHNQYLWIM